MQEWIRGGCEHSQMRELGECMRPVGKPKENVDNSDSTQQQETQSQSPKVSPTPVINWL